MTPLHDTPTIDIKSQVVRDAILSIGHGSANVRVLQASTMLVAQMSDDEARRLGRMLK